LPDGVGHAPEARQREEEPALAGMRRPSVQDGDDEGVDGGADAEDGHAPHKLDGPTECEAECGVAQGVGDEHEAHVLHAVGARDVTLGR